MKHTVHFIAGTVPKNKERVQPYQREHLYAKHLKALAGLVTTAHESVPQNVEYMHGGGVGELYRTFAASLQSERAACLQDSSVQQIAYMCFIAWKSFTHGQRYGDRQAYAMRTRAIITQRADLKELLLPSKLKQQACREIYIVLYAWAYLPLLRRALDRWRNRQVRDKRTLGRYFDKLNVYYASRKLAKLNCKRFIDVIKNVLLLPHTIPEYKVLALQRWRKYICYQRLLQTTAKLCFKLWRHFASLNAEERNDTAPSTPVKAKATTPASSSSAVIGASVVLNAAGDKSSSPVDGQHLSELQTDVQTALNNVSDVAGLSTMHIARHLDLDVSLLSVRESWEVKADAAEEQEWAEDAGMSDMSMSDSRGSALNNTNNEQAYDTSDGGMSLSLGAGTRLKSPMEKMGDTRYRYGSSRGAEETGVLQASLDAPLSRDALVDDHSGNKNQLKGQVEGRGTPESNGYRADTNDPDGPVFSYASSAQTSATPSTRATPQSTPQRSLRTKRQHESPVIFRKAANNRQSPASPADAKGRPLAKKTAVTRATPERRVTPPKAPLTAPHGKATTRAEELFLMRMNAVKSLSEDFNSANSLAAKRFSSDRASASASVWNRDLKRK